MDLDRYVNRLLEQLVVASEAGGEEARAVAERLVGPLESAVRLMLLDVLGVAAAEITRELAPGAVDLRLRGGDPEFVVSAMAPGADAAPSGEAADSGWREGGWTAGVGEGGVARINLRLPEQLKERVERAADREGLSINAWLVRAAAAAVQRGEAGLRNDPGTPRGGQHITGWGR